jgi:hypothetical protein
VSESTIQSVARSLPAIFFENINCKKLASRLGLPESWVRNHVRRGCVDQIPHVKLGGKIIFEWGSDALNGWWNRHRIGYEAPAQNPEGQPDQEARELARPVRGLEGGRGRGARMARAVFNSRIM